MAIGRDEVRHIARLAHLDFTDDEYERFTRQLNAILEYVAQLERLDTSTIEPTSHLVGVTQTLRPDRARPAFTQEQALANAPDSADGQFKVPRVIG